MWVDWKFSTRFKYNDTWVDQNTGITWTFMLTIFPESKMAPNNPPSDAYSINIWNITIYVYLNIVKICNVPSKYGIFSHFILIYLEIIQYYQYFNTKEKEPTPPYLPLTNKYIQFESKFTIKFILNRLK